MEEAFEEEDMLPRDLNNSTAYDFEHRPATKPLDVMTEAIFKGDETDFGQALHKIHKKVKIKGVTMKIPEININVRSVKVNNPRAGKEKGKDDTHLAIVHFSMNDDDIPLVTLNFWDSKKGYTLSLKKTSNGETQDLMVVVNAFKYLIDNLVDNVITDAKLAAYFQNIWDSKEETCPPCGKTFKRLPGSRAHKCAVISGLQKTFDCDPCGERFECESKLVKHNEKSHREDGINYRLNKTPISGIPPSKKVKKIDDSMKNVAPSNELMDAENVVPANEPMDTQTIEVAALRAALASDMIDQNLQVPNRKILVTDYLRENYPGKIVVNVAADGGCLPRAASVPLFKGDYDWIVISKAINKYIRNNWFLIKTECFVNFPLDCKVGPTKEVTFQNEVEYLEFLKTDEAIYIWRDHHDLVALCEILQVKITVIVVKEDYVDGVHDVLPVSGNMIDEKDDRMVLLHAGEHYRAVVPPMVSIRHDKELLQMMAKYIKDDVKSPPLVNAPAQDSAHRHCAAGPHDCAAQAPGPAPAPPVPVTAPAPFPAPPTPAPAPPPVPVPTPDIALRRKVEEMEKMLSNMQSRLTGTQIDLEVLKKENEAHNRSCAEHIKELEALKLADAKNKNLMSELKQLERRIDAKYMKEKPEEKKVISDDEELEQLKTLNDLKNQGAIRVSPQVSPQMKSVARCDKCKIEFISKDILEKHVVQAHPLIAHKPQKPVNDPSPMPIQFWIPLDKILWETDQKG